jgi:enoyl-CoA hydratase
MDPQSETPLVARARELLAAEYAEQRSQEWLDLRENMITASEALQLGLVNHVVPKEELLSLANLILTKICTKAPIAIQHIIHLVNQAAIGAKDGLQQEFELFGACFDTEDKKEGISAFLEKRKASFKGA